MTEARRVGSGSFVLRTVTPGRSRPGPGVVWLDGIALMDAATAPWCRPEAAVAAPVATAEGGRGNTVSATIEVPAGYLVVDVRVGYGTATGALMSAVELADLNGQRKSILVLLERRDHPKLDPSLDRAALFGDVPTAPPGERTFVSVEASLADRSDHVAVRNLRVHLTRG